MKSKFLLALLALVPFSLTGCAEIELGSHLFKRSTQLATASSDYGSATSSPGGNFKVGKPYTVNGTTYRPTETYEYSETGIASWYGPGFHGKKTASGEIYDKNELTAAHKTLQMPSFVRVTNLGNGKSVIVRVNDRGPFSKGRVIDVSYKAADLLGMIGTGTAKVRVDLLAEESRIIAQAARRGQNVKGTEIAMNTSGQLPDYLQPQTVYDVPPAPADDSPYPEIARTNNIQGHYVNGRFYPDAVATQVPVSQTGLFVQAGVFGVPENAQRLSVQLASIAPTSVVPVTSGNRTLYKVRLGPLMDVEEADSVLNRVATSGRADAIIVVQ